MHNGKQFAKLSGQQEICRTAQESQRSPDSLDCTEWDYMQPGEAKS